MSAPIPRALTIAGSDSGGGAGIEADLKTFTALKVYGMAAITSITAQNTMGVHGVRDLPPDMVEQQIGVVVEDIGVDAVKSGMLSNAAIIEAVADCIARHKLLNYVLDPVMVSESGHSLLAKDAVEVLKRRLLPLALVVTPNVPEAVALSGRLIRGVDDLREAGAAIHALGPRYVLMKGGHLEGAEATDYLFDGDCWRTYSAERVKTTSTHGTGCTYAAAIAAYLAKGLDLPVAVSRAKVYLTGALRNGLKLGHGHGPLDHAWNIPD